MNAPRVNILEQDNSFSSPNVLTGISGMAGITERGPVNDPSKVITSELEYRKLFGGLMTNNDFPAQCLRHLKLGGKLRVNRIVHYTNIADRATATALAPTAKPITDSIQAGNPLLYTVTPKYRGVKYNDLKHEVVAASNGIVNYFNLKLYLSSDMTNTLEVYENLMIPTGATLLNSTHLDSINLRSKLVTLSYADNGQLSGLNRPANGVTAFTGGSDGGAVVPTDYAGDAGAQTGLYAFDPFDDMMQIATPSVYNADINQAGGFYADQRGDLMFFAHLDHTINDTSTLTAARALTTIDTKYLAFFSGGVTLKENNVVKQMSEIADVMAIASYVDENFGPWFSLGNAQRGQVRDALGVTTNFGSVGNYAKLNELAQRQINMMVNSNGITQLSGNSTAQLAESKASFLNIVRGLIYLKKKLRPILQRYIGDPTDLVTFKLIFGEAQPILDDMVSKRALYNYLWDGDQDVSRIEDVVVNTLADLDLGKYKIRLGIEPIAGLGMIDLIISLNRTGELNIELKAA